LVLGVHYLHVSCYNLSDYINTSEEYVLKVSDVLLQSEKQIEKEELLSETLTLPGKTRKAA